MKLDILVISAHPDDAELSAGGTIIKHVDMGYQVGMIDLTRGEMGTRGSAEKRDQESAKAAEIMGVKIRENLNLPDAHLQDSFEMRVAVVQKIRQYQPDIILTNYSDNRHPDHAIAADLVRNSAFLAGLAKWPTEVEGESQEHWRVRHVYHFIQYYPHTPDFVVEIKDVLDRKMKAIFAYDSQFFDAESKEPQTVIARPEFLGLVQSRTMVYGNYAGLDYAEGFISGTKPAVKSLFNLI